MLIHAFNADIAAEYKDVDLAVLIQHFIHWIHHNQKMERNFRQDRTWSYQTFEEIAAHYPYWSRDQVRRLLKKAVDFKILRKGNFNKSKFDRTLWYAFENEEKFTIGRNRPKERPESANGKGESAPPIPHTKPITKPDTEKRVTARPLSLPLKKSKRIRSIFNV